MALWALLLAATVLATTTRPLPADAHSRWVCPKPRSDNSGLKLGPCGGVGSINDANHRDRLEIAPGPFTVYFQETIVHRGAPFRVALSKPGADSFESCVLLDHIPHLDGALPSRIYGITVNIPDIDCRNCALQLIQIMTDKVKGQCTFNPDDTTSFENNQCGSNYFSCANVRISGTLPFDPALCSQPRGFKQDYLYKSNEAGAWTGFYMSSGPDSVRLPVDGPCSRKMDPAFETLESADVTSITKIRSPVLTGVLILIGLAVVFGSITLAARLWRRQRANEDQQGIQRNSELLLTSKTHNISV